MVYLLLVFGFDIRKPPEVKIMYLFRICYNFGQFDSWRIRQKMHIFADHLQITTLGEFVIF